MRGCPKHCRRFCMLGAYACYTCTDPEKDLIADSVLDRLPDIPDELRSEVEYAIRTKITKESSDDMSIIKRILSVWGEPIINLTRSEDGHLPEDDVAGVLFEVDRPAARFGLRRIIGRMTNLGDPSVLSCISDKNNFYNFYSEQFETNPIPLSIKEMDHYIDAPFQYTMSVNSLKLQEFIVQRFPSLTVRRRVKAVVDVGCSYNPEVHLIVPKFDFNGDYWIFNHPKLVKDCIIHKYSVIQDVLPDTMYLTRKVEENGRFIYLNVLRRFELCTRLAFYDTEINTRDLTFDKFDIDSYHPRDIIKFDLTFHPSNYQRCTPVVISADILFNILKLFGGIETINISINNGINPVCFENERQATTEPIIEVVAMPVITGER